jgi:hypothetical protein
VHAWKRVFVFIVDGLRILALYMKIQFWALFIVRKGKGDKSLIGGKGLIVSISIWILRFFLLFIIIFLYKKLLILLFKDL